MSIRAIVLLTAALLVVPVGAQENAPQHTDSGSTLRVTSRAVLVDVVVLDKHGKPVTGLTQNMFHVTEQGKPQAITFFEEHHASAPAQNIQIPQLPPNEFTNESPFSAPPAVNVLLLDSLNTRMNNQSYVHDQALKFLSSAKPGQRMAIFAMGLGLHFIQGFNDDPSVLVAALRRKGNNAVEPAVLLKSGMETTAQNNLLGMMSAQVPSGPNGSESTTSASGASIAALRAFLTEQDVAQSTDRMYRTLENLQRLAVFLGSFPGRKNVIWFSESVPSWFVFGPGQGATGESLARTLRKGSQPGAATTGSIESVDPRIEQEVKKTLAMLAAARAVLYPVDPRGVATNASYAAENTMGAGESSSSLLVGPRTIENAGGFANSTTSEDQERNTDQENADMLAQESGGRAFANSNSLAKVMDTITGTSGDFYTLSYVPSNRVMDGSYRTISIKADGQDKLSYRHGYFAVEDTLPGGALIERNLQAQRLADRNPGKVDPLMPFMDLAMPELQQIRMKVRVQPVPPAQDQAAAKQDSHSYSVDYSLALNDLDLKLDASGVRNGKLTISLIVYDRYGKIVNREDHLVGINVKPDVYSIFQQNGVQLHANLGAPGQNLWLRTGVYDHNSGKVGTLEIPLAAVLPAGTHGSK